MSDIAFLLTVTSESNLKLDCRDGGCSFKQSPAESERTSFAKFYINVQRVLDHSQTKKSETGSVLERCIFDKGDKAIS